VRSQASVKAQSLPRHSDKASATGRTSPPLPSCSLPGGHAVSKDCAAAGSCVVSGGHVMPGGHVAPLTGAPDKCTLTKRRPANGQRLWGRLLSDGPANGQRLWGRLMSGTRGPPGAGSCVIWAVMACVPPTNGARLWGCVFFERPWRSTVEPACLPPMVVCHLSGDGRAVEPACLPPVRGDICQGAWTSRAGGPEY